MTEVQVPYIVHEQPPLIVPTECRDTNVAVLHEIDLGAHHLLLMSDQSIDLVRGEEAPYVADNILSLDSCEAYRLMISLQEMFKAVRE